MSERWSTDVLIEEARKLYALGIPVLALFPNVAQEKRSADGREAWKSRWARADRNARTEE